MYKQRKATIMNPHDPIIQFIIALSPTMIGLFIQLVNPVLTFFSNLSRRNRRHRAYLGGMPRSLGRTENRLLALSGILGSIGVSIILYIFYQNNMINDGIAYIYSILLLILSIAYLVASIISYRNREGKKRDRLVREFEEMEQFSQENGS